MRVLKQLFSQWFNSGHARKGTLWEERFRSVVVEGGDALRTVAWYIDLNPIRAGIVSEPEAYRWCGYGEAVAGVSRARQGLKLLLQSFVAGIKSTEPLLAAYRLQLYLTGEDREEGRRGQALFQSRRLFPVKTKRGAHGLLGENVSKVTKSLRFGSERDQTRVNFSPCAVPLKAILP